MNICVFIGPTLTPGEASAVLDATYLPPAAQGDVYRAAKNRPLALGIVDGLFQHVPSVWHKEILWAMAQGIHVFGSASMGALRAAELYTFGMIGVGKIFEAYRDGVLADDDEVAVLHGPPELNYVALSEAMINIRCTLRAAERKGIVTGQTRRHLENIAKSLFYQDRCFPTILAQATNDQLDKNELARLRQSLPNVIVNQKRNDAKMMLRHMKSALRRMPEAGLPSYVLENTRTWIPDEEETERWGQGIP